MKYIDFENNKVTKYPSLRITSGDEDMEFTPIDNLFTNKQTFHHKEFRNRDDLCDFVNNNMRIMIEYIDEKDDTVILWYWL